MPREGGVTTVFLFMPALALLAKCPVGRVNGLEDHFYLLITVSSPAVKLGALVVLGDTSDFQYTVRNEILMSLSISTFSLGWKSHTVSHDSWLYNNTTEHGNSCFSTSPTPF